MRPPRQHGRWCPLSTTKFEKKKQQKKKPSNMVPIFNKVYLITVKEKKRLIIN